MSADIEEMDTECTTTDDVDEATDAESYTMKKLLSTRELRMPLFIAVMLQVMQQFSGINAVSIIILLLLYICKVLCVRIKNLLKGVNKIILK